MNLLLRFQSNIKDQHLFTPNDRLLLAVSGGVDSVVLCELCKQAGYDFIIAHCNFQLRGEESERDEMFVRQLGESYKVAVEVKKFETETYADKMKISIQEAARDLRYNWFAQLVTGPDYRLPPPASLLPPPAYLLTAHHADDNIETVLMNFFRGTGLHGMTGIPAMGTYSSANFIRRPLLPFSKQELIQFATEHNLQFVEDSSNQSSKYTRNYFRNEVIPAIRKVYPQVSDNLQDNIDRFKEIEKLYKVSVGEIKKRLCKMKQEEMHIPIKQLLGYASKALIYEIISDYGFSEKQIDEVIKLANGDSGSYMDSVRGNFRIIKHRHWFIIAPVGSASAENIIIEENEKKVLFANGNLTLELSANSQPIAGNNVACLDTTHIQFPLLLRKWKTGDYFYPLGMKKKKKLSRFFIDQKLSKTAKEKTWVIEMNKKIIWVVGHRIDDRFKITDKSTRVLTITLHS